MLPSSLPTPLGPTKIYLYAKNVDMRKSFDGLHAIVQSEFQRDIRLGDLFLFLNRRLDRIKLIHWERDGLVIWMKRLEKGNFQRPQCVPGADHVEMDATDLAILLAGLELASVKRRPRYHCDTASLAAAPQKQGSGVSSR
ncbi:MAG TPA: IS66 family insertion sequence element accessory protein TnpB [Pirellulales bacterium]|jgi:transposase|nr:IS66 family insertion sequence element accessory protein TnpB [Pirellulales bacterium]